MRYVPISRAHFLPLASSARSPSLPLALFAGPKEPYALARFGVPGWHSSEFRAPKSDRSFAIENRSVSRSAAPFESVRSVVRFQFFVRRFRKED